MSSVTTERVFAPALEKIRSADRSVGEAIGSLEMAGRDDDRALLAGYSGATSLKHLRACRKEIQKALALLEALGGHPAGG